MLNTLERIRGYRVENEQGCLVWKGALEDGYGRTKYKGKRRPVHRILWEEVHGPVVEGYELDHKCRNRACSNINHLRVVTCQQNLLASPITWASINAAKTHCPKGHEYTEDNIYKKVYTSSGKYKRHCKQCKAEYQLRYREAKASKQKEESKIARYRERAARIVEAVKLTFPVTFDCDGETVIAEIGDFLVTEPDGAQVIMDAAEFETEFELMATKGPRPGTPRKKKGEVTAEGASVEALAA